MHTHGDVPPLRGIHVISLALNVPGPAAAARLCRLGAVVTKVEPPAGDPLASVCPSWYEELCAGQDVVRLDLKDAAGRASLDGLLEGADLLLTSSRPAALARLGLSWPHLHVRFPRLVQVAIVGHAAPRQDVPGHDLTYLASAGLLVPPQVPRTLLADLAGAEQAVSTALALLYARERGHGAGYGEVALADVAAAFAAPLRHGLTAADEFLGGGFAGYGLYRAREGWIAVAALEPHFWRRLTGELEASDDEGLARVFVTQTAQYWEAWGAAQDVPLAAVQDCPGPPLRGQSPREAGGLVAGDERTSPWTA
jgi:crotonobetainyl-CoA:carnitine CoA-transferase CaiB-like acyl-CoA transferase